MASTVADIIKIMENIAPAYLAEEWDNVGLQVGKMDWPVRHIWIALDPIPDVVAAACSKDVDLLITHHPLIFQPIRSIDFSSSIGAVIQMASQHNLAVFAAHTNLDNAENGINDILAYKIGLKNLKVLEKVSESENRQGIGRVGELDQGTILTSFALKIKEKLGLEWVKIAGKPELSINKAVVCAGSGSSLIKNFFSSGAQVFISGDLRYHDAREVSNKNLGLIDIGHFASEHLIVDVLAERLQKMINETGLKVKVDAYKLENDPFIII